MQTIKTLRGSLGTFASADDEIHHLDDKVQELERVKEGVVHSVELAKKKGQRPDQLAELWLAEVDALEHYWTQIQSESQRSSWFLNPRSSFAIKKKVLDRLEAAKELLRMAETLKMLAMEDKMKFGDTSDLPKPSSSGTDATFKLLKDSVQDGQEGVIGLCGMGGVGKTMLLKRLHEEICFEGKAFDVVAMVEASMLSSEEDIQTLIGKELGLEFGDTEDKMERRDCIYHYLKSKNFLMILDDVWEKMDLQSIGIPIPNCDSKSKIVIGSRIAKVCTLMEVEKRIDMGCLPWRESWNLFRSETGMGLKKFDPEIIKHATSLTHKCGGLPLALQTIGRAMKGKETCEEWEEASKCMDDDPSMIPGMEKVFECLMRSYDFIKGDELKKCFLHCTIFQEDAPFLKSVLSTSFLSHGLLGIGEDIIATFYKGINISNELARMCMLESDEDNNGDGILKMHATMYNAALWVASERGRKKGNFIVRAKVNSELMLDFDKWGGAEFISFLESNIIVLPVAPVCSNLASIILANNPSLDCIPEGFLASMPSLEVLDLSRTSLKELPTEIGLLTNLRYLNLKGTRLVSLPEEVGNLGRLKYLDVSWVPSLKMIPKNVISRLSSSLKVLNLFYSYRYWEVGSSMASDRLLMEELEDLGNLKGLGITIDARDTLAKLANSKRLATTVVNLHLSFLQGVESIGLPDPALGDNMKNITQLVVSSSTDLNELVIGGKNLDCSSNIKSLQLMGLTKLEKIVYKLPGATSCLQALHRLHISSCPLIETVLDTDSDVVLPNLQDLYLGDLHELKSICQNISSMPCLKTLKVKGCPNLTKLPCGIRSIKSLKCIRGYNKWWEDLEWEDEGDMPFLATLFKALG